MIRIAQDVFTAVGVSSELIRPVGYEIAAGLEIDMLPGLELPAPCPDAQGCPRGYPAHGNVLPQGQAGCHRDRANPEHRA